MAAEIPLFSAHPVESDECQAHGHEYETQCSETRSLKTQRRHITVGLPGPLSFTSMNCCCVTLSVWERCEPTWIFGLDFIGSWSVGMMRM